MQESGIVRRMMKLVPEMTFAQGKAAVDDLCQGVASAAGASGEDEAVATWLEGHASEVDARVEQERQRATEEQIYRLIASLPTSRRGDVVRDLVGYSRVADMKGFAPGARV